MNLIFIGNDVDKLAMEVWQVNTNYTVLNQISSLWGKEFLKYIKGRQVIATTSSDQFKDKDINVFVEYMTKHEFIPIFIADNGKSFERTMHTAIEELLPNSLLWTRNKDNKEYNELVKIAQGYLLGKGIIKSDDKSLRPSKKGKRTSTKK